MDPSCCQPSFWHDAVIKWKHFPRYWPFVWGIHRSPVNSPHKGKWRGALMFSLICAWINAWVNNRETGDLRRHRAHYDVIVMSMAAFNISLAHTQNVPGVPGDTQGKWPFCQAKTHGLAHKIRVIWLKKITNLGSQQNVYDSRPKYFNQYHIIWTVPDDGIVMQKHQQPQSRLIISLVWYFLSKIIFKHILVSTYTKMYSNWWATEPNLNSIFN